jgi:hypothetical protein
MSVYRNISNQKNLSKYFCAYVLLPNGMDKLWQIQAEGLAFKKNNYYFSFYSLTKTVQPCFKILII